MIAPHTLEFLAAEVVRERLADARQAMLAADLAHGTRRPPAGTGAVRHTLAVGLRHLAGRLDPSLSLPSARVATTAPR
jgi:hypothetical protein